MPGNIARLTAMAAIGEMIRAKPSDTKGLMTHISSNHNASKSTKILLRCMYMLLRNPLNVFFTIISYLNPINFSNISDMSSGFFFWL